MLTAQHRTIQRDKLVHAGKMHLVHWLIVSLSIVLTLSAWYFSKTQAEQKIEAKFERYTEQAVSLVKERIELYENALWGGVAFIDATNQSITNNLWKTYANSLKLEQSYPGVMGMGIIYNIKPQHLNTYIAEQHSQRPNYAIHPQHDKTEYWPITYIEPVEQNKKAVGLDMAFETNRYTAIKKARDTGRTQLTGPINLIQDAKKTPGFLFYAPFYKNGKKPTNIENRRTDIVGVTYAPFIMKNLMLGTLEEKNRSVSITITDDDVLLYDDKDNQSALDFDPTPLFTKKVEVPMHGRTWSFLLESNLSFRAASTSNQSSFILIGGLIIDSLLFGVFILLTRANRMALSYADAMTAELEKKTESLEKSNSDLEQFSYIASHDLKSPLNAIQQLITWIDEDCRHLLPEASKEHIALLKQRSNRMLKLLNDLLDYSRANTKKHTNESIELQTLCEDIWSLGDNHQNFALSAQKVTLNSYKAPLEIILRNLMSNAIKHHDKEQGHIAVTYNTIGNNHKISVTDDGPGIPPEFQQKAMEMFETLQPRDKVEGSGMGLAMIKRIIEHYQGTVTINSDGKRGTTVNIIWPIKK